MKERVLFLNKLYEIIKDRQAKMPKGSYVASLFKKGKDRIIQKVGEEAIEVLIAAKNKDKKRIISEVVDLWFHLLIMLSYFDIKIQDINSELKEREK